MWEHVIILIALRKGKTLWSLAILSAVGHSECNRVKTYIPCIWLIGYLYNCTARQSCLIRQNLSCAL